MYLDLKNRLSELFITLYRRSNNNYQQMSNYHPYFLKLNIELDTATLYKQILKKELYVQIYSNVYWSKYKKESLNLFTSYWLILLNIQKKTNLLKFELLLSLIKTFQIVLYNVPKYNVKLLYNNFKSEAMYKKYYYNYNTYRPNISTILKKKKYLWYRTFFLLWNIEHKNKTNKKKKNKIILLNNLNNKHLNSFINNNSVGLLTTKKKISQSKDLSYHLYIHNIENIKKNWMISYFINLLKHQIKSFIKKIFDAGQLNRMFLKCSLLYPIKQNINSESIRLYINNILKYKSNMLFNMEFTFYTLNLQYNRTNKKEHFLIKMSISDIQNSLIANIKTKLHNLSTNLQANHLLNFNFIANGFKKKKYSNNFYITSTLWNEYYINSKYLKKIYIENTLNDTLNWLINDTTLKWSRWTMNWILNFEKKIKQLIMEWTIHELRSKEKKPLEIHVKLKNPSLIQLYQYRTVQELCRNRGHFEAYVSQTIQSYKRVGYPKNMDLNFKQKIKEKPALHEQKIEKQPLFEDTYNLDTSIHDYRWVLYFMYNDFHIQKFINFLIKKGKKFKALSIFYNVLTLLKDITSISPIYIIKTLFSSNQKMFFFEAKEVKKKKKIKIIFFKWKKRIMTPFHFFFKELKELHLTDYITITEQIVYLLLNNLDEFSGSQLEELAIPEVEKVLKHKYILKNKTRNIQKKNKKIKGYYSKYKANKEIILNYKKKF